MIVVSRVSDESFSALLDNELFICKSPFEALAVVVLVGISSDKFAELLCRILERDPLNILLSTFSFDFDVISVSSLLFPDGDRLNPEKTSGKLFS
jgi:hypothetical protein